MSESTGQNTTHAAGEVVVSGVGMVVGVTRVPLGTGSRGRDNATLLIRSGDVRMGTWEDTVAGCGERRGIEYKKNRKSKQKKLVSRSQW